MAREEAQAWVQRIAQSVATENGENLPALLGLLHPSTGEKRKLPAFAAQGQTDSLGNFTRNLPEAWAELVVEYVGCMGALERREYVATYKGLAAAYAKLL